MPKALTFLSMGTGEPDDAKVSRPVRGGTGRKGSNDLARGLPYLRSRFQRRLNPSVDMTSNVKSWSQLFEVCMRFDLLRAWEEAEPGRIDG
jgi:hypothetical protein